MISYLDLKNNKIINLLIILMIFIIFLTLIHGYQCKYIIALVCRENDYLNNFLLENGPIENIQSIFLFFSILILLSLISKIKFNKFLKIFVILKVLALTYYFGEEISWGQHFFKWGTPQIFTEVNNQNETNLHNISNLLDQLPRSLVILWCGFIPIIFYYSKKKLYFNKNINLIILPKAKLLVISFIFLFFFLPDFIIDKANLHPGHYVGGKDVKEAVYYDIISFNFLTRLSELHELIFCFYFLIYSIAFSDELKKIR